MQMTGLSVAIFLDPYRSLKIAIFHSDCRYVTFTSVEDYMYLMNHGSKAVHNNHHMALNFTLYLREAFFVGDVYLEPFNHSPQCKEKTSYHHLNTICGFIFH